MNLRITIILNIIDSHRAMEKGCELEVHENGFQIIKFCLYFFFPDSSLYGQETIVDLLP